MTPTDWLLPGDVLRLAGNHLWQSTLVLAAVWLLAATLRANRAAVRYRVWLAGVVKFLVPLDALIEIGRHAGTRLPTATQTPFTAAMGTASQPFSRAVPTEIVQFAAPDGGSLLPAVLLVSIWASGALVAISAWAIAWRRIARLAHTGDPLGDPRMTASVRRVAGRLGLAAPVPVRCSTDRMEPGVFGIWRPVLLWPRHLTEHLSDSEIDAIVAHELCHVRRRDNLAAALHAVVRALFWFHPLLWLAGHALHAERERACDEEVLQFGFAPRAYAEGIVKTCAFCVQAPMAAVAGVTGGLPARIVQIMRGHSASALGSLQRVSLATGAMAMLVLPLWIGVNTAPFLRAEEPAVAGGAPAFEVASVKLNVGSDLSRRFEALPGGRVNLINLTAREIIFRAYQTQDHLLIGGPSWLNVDRFDVVAKAAGNAPPNQMLAMVRTLLADRFKLVMHRETRDMPIYNLVLARPDGRGVQPKPTTCAPPPPGAPVAIERDSQGRSACGVNRFGGGELLLTGTTLAAVANRLGSQPGVGRTVIDRTGLDGRFDVELTFTPTLSATSGQEGSSIFTALDEQAGLRLEPARGPVQVLVIDGIERPDQD